MSETVENDLGKEEEKVAYEDVEEFTFTKEEEQALVAKFDTRVLPLMCATYVMNYVDRGNIGNAKVAGVAEDLGINDNLWRNAVLNVFYIVYICFEWTGILWKIFPAHIYVSITVFVFGSVSMLHGAAFNLPSMVVCRIFLGIFEGMFGAGAPYFMSFFWKRNEFGVRLGTLLAMSPVANCFAGALAYGLTSIRSSIDGWRLLFIVEGAPALILAIFVFFFLPDSPQQAKFVTEREKKIIQARTYGADSTKKQSFSKKQIFTGLFDPINYLHAANHFCCNFSFAGLSLFLPTIVHDMGYNHVDANGLVAPVYIVAAIANIGMCKISDRFALRGPFIVFSSIVGAAGYLMLALGRSVAVRYAAMYLAASGIFSCLALNMTWMLMNNGGHTKRSVGMSLLAIIGQTSSFVSTAVFPERDGPLYIRGTATGVGLTGLVGISSFCLFFYLRNKNKKRDELHGVPDPNEHFDLSDQGDSHPMFRYLI